MRRTIKFRGKSKRTGQWLHGDLVRNVEGTFAVVPPFEMTTCNRCEQYEVEKDTVGQSTSLLDENQNEIFEGDIVDWTFFYKRYFGGGATERDTIIKGVIEWMQGGFVLNVIKNDFECAGIYCISELNTDTESDVAVLGNIHDNPELLNQN